jgi:hypothetical protein
MSCARYTNSSRARTDKRINLVPHSYSIDLGAFWVALLICYPQRYWNVVIAILSECCDASRRVTLATPYGNPGCLPLSNPTICRKLGLHLFPVATRSFLADSPQPRLCRDRLGHLQLPYGTFLPLSPASKRVQSALCLQPNCHSPSLSASKIRHRAESGQIRTRTIRNLHNITSQNLCLVSDRRRSQKLRCIKWRHIISNHREAVGRHVCAHRPVWHQEHATRGDRYQTRPAVV